MNFLNKFILTLCFIFLSLSFITVISFADEPTIYSPSAILIDSKTGKILYEKDANLQMYPASTTKVLTAIIALESCPLDEKIIASENAVKAVKAGYTNANIQAR